MKTTITLILLLSAYLLPGIAQAETTIDFKVTALSPYDNRAVVTMPNGKLEVLSTGDEINEQPYKIVQIMPDRLVLRDISRKENAGDIVWVYLSKPGEKAKIERHKPNT